MLSLEVKIIMLPEKFTDLEDRDIIQWDIKNRSPLNKPNYAKYLRKFF